jgi:predicted GH43/DUF377 family glycosyl hydrolase
VVVENNQYKMVYGNAIAQNAMGMAASSDGFHFIKQSAPFFIYTNTVKNYVQVAYPCFRKLNNEYRIYYTSATSSGDLSFNLLSIPNK